VYSARKECVYHYCPYNGILCVESCQHQFTPTAPLQPVGPTGGYPVADGYVNTQTLEPHVQLEPMTEETADAEETLP
jgi:hypothetical protein